MKLNINNLIHLKMDKKMIVFSKGFNGDITYSIFIKEGIKPIFTKMTLKELSKSIIRTYPDISGKISKFYKEDFSGYFPEEIDLSKLDPGPRAELIKLIAENV